MSGMLPLRDTDPREVGGYRLLGRLGEGGQGVVFLALSPTGVRAAIKLLPPTTDPRVRSRFLKEVSAAQQVAGYCTAQVLDAGIFERRPYIVTEYVSGPSLVEVVQEHGPRHGKVLERIAVATLTALGAVHGVGMVHRDFKPGNVLLGPGGPVVIDFGLAAVPGMTTTGLSGQVAVGTPAFMAPEQLAGARVTSAADMWSWAVTIAYTGTGELPFKGESLTATAYAILHSEPAVGSLPDPLGSIIHRCLSKNPAFRPTARAALRELVAAGARPEGPLPPEPAADPAAEEISGPQGPPAGPPEQRQRSDDGLAAARPESGSRQRSRPGGGRARRRWRPVAVLASVALVAGIGGTAFLLTRHGPAPRSRPGGHAGGSGPIDHEAAVRAQAVNWITQQVSRAAVVSCDAQVCADLVMKGFPLGDVKPLGNQSNDPLGSNLVVATAAIRAQYGSRLASVYAPAVIASFGSGSARIDIRLVFPGGTTRYRSAQQAAARTRKADDAQLLENRQITFSATAKQQLRSGDIDPRLTLLIDGMAHYHPLGIVQFTGQSPGGGPASLLRSVDLATADSAAHLAPAPYVAWMRSFVNAQRAEFRPAWSQEVTLATGHTALRVGYYAPSPLSLTGLPG
jgi:predicted Ser/Thr protein kinase